MGDVTPLIPILFWIGWSLSGIRHELRAALTDTKGDRPMGDR